MRFTSPNIQAATLDASFTFTSDSSSCKLPPSPAVIIPQLTLSSDSKRASETGIILTDSRRQSSHLGSSSSRRKSASATTATASSVSNPASPLFPAASSAIHGMIQEDEVSSQLEMLDTYTNLNSDTFSGPTTNHQRKLSVIENHQPRNNHNVEDDVGQKELDKLLKKALGNGSSSRKASAVFRKATKRGSTATQLFLKTGINPRGDPLDDRDVATIVNDIVNPQAKIELTEEEIHERALYHWKLAIGFVVRGIKSTSMFASNRKGQGNSLPIVNSSAFSEQAFKYLLKTYQTRADVVLNTKVIFYYLPYD
jgi:hypothetical protein